MVNLSPKDLFQSNNEDVRAFAAVANNSIMQKAATSAFAEYVFNCAPSKEQVEAVKNFMVTFFGMADKPKPPSRMPDKALKFEVQPPTQTK